MSEKMMLENKLIVVNENKYRLTIKRKLARTGRFYFYKAYLSDINSQFTISRIFNNSTQLEKGLKSWIIEADIFNDPEARIFKELESWDGVINI